MIKDEKLAKTFKQVRRFLIGGGSGVFCDYLSYFAFLHLGLSVSISKAISYAVGATVGFLINKFYTFEVNAFSKKEIVKYVGLYLFSACANTAVNTIVLGILTTKPLGFLVATGVSTVINFVGQKFFVFQR